MIFKTILLGLSLGMCAGLAAAGDQAPTALTINNAEYEKRCGAGSDPNYPCFTFVGGDLNDVHVEITKGEFGDLPTTSLLVRDDQMRDFTIDDPSKSFSIIWRGYNNALFSYEPQDTSRACSRIGITVLNWTDSRLWINDGLLNGENIDIDTKGSGHALGDFCSKWIRIHVGNDG